MSDVSRRSTLHAAWAVPTVIIAAPAPAIAASGGNPDDQLIHPGFSYSIVTKTSQEKPNDKASNSTPVLVVSVINFATKHNFTATKLTITLTLSSPDVKPTQDPRLPNTFSFPSTYSSTSDLNGKTGYDYVFELNLNNEVCTVNPDNGYAVLQIPDGLYVDTLEGNGLSIGDDARATVELTTTNSDINAPGNATLSIPDNDNAYTVVEYNG